MARDYGDYARRGATVAAVVIDPPERNAAMVEKLALPFPILADPVGDTAAKPYGVWDDGGRMALPAIVVLGPDGEEAYRYVGVDFMDRPNDDDLLAAVERLDLPAIEPATEIVPHLPPRPGPRAVALRDLAVYLRGVRFAMAAMAERARDRFDRTEAERTVVMADRYLAAIATRRRLTEGRPDSHD